MRGLKLYQISVQYNHCAIFSWHDLHLHLEKNKNIFSEITFSKIWAEGRNDSVCQDLEGALCEVRLVLEHKHVTRLFKTSTAHTALPIRSCEFESALRRLIMPRTYATKTGVGGSSKPFQDHRDPKPIFKETVPKRPAPGCKRRCLQIIYVND